MEVLGLPDFSQLSKTPGQFTLELFNGLAFTETEICLASQITSELDCMGTWLVDY